MSLSLSLSLARASSEYRALQTRRLCLSKVPNTTTLCSSERRNRRETDERDRRERPTRERERGVRDYYSNEEQKCEKSGVFLSFVRRESTEEEEEEDEKKKIERRVSVLKVFLSQFHQF